MDILYIVGRDSECDNLELRCSLRSIAVNGRNVGRVIVAGHCPDWLSDEVVKVPCEDINSDTETPLTKAQNIARKFIAAISSFGAEQEFLVSMDDHFYVSPIDFDNYPLYAKDLGNGGTIPVKGRSAYTRFIVKCGQRLQEMGYPTWFTALHRNIRVSRRDYEECVEEIEENLSENKPFEMFLWLGNHAIKAGRATPVLVTDNRIRGAEEWWRTSPEHDHVFSTGNFPQGSGLYWLLKGLYPGRCKYEKSDIV